jgi:hypothetical protein
MRTSFRAALGFARNQRPQQEIIAEHLPSEAQRLAAEEDCVPVS